jgi:Protein of unknown function (DUF4232)
MQRHKDMKPTRLAAGIACLAWAAAVTGCGATVTSGTAPAVPITPPARTNSAAPSDIRCAPAQLQLIRQGLVSEATQQLTWVIGLHNTAAAGCGLDGYPAIALLDSHRTRLPYGFRAGGDQMLTSAAPAPVWLRPGGTAYFGINKNACTTRDVDLATVIRVIPPGAQSALTLPAPSQRIMDYCGRGVAGSVVDISPVEPDIAAVFAHH